MTIARRYIDDHRTDAAGPLSFTGYLAYCLARAVDQDKSVQAYPKGRRSVAIFDDVDVFLPIERELGGTLAAVPYVIRAANHKSVLEIHREIAWIVIPEEDENTPVAPAPVSGAATRTVTAIVGAALVGVGFLLLAEHPVPWLSTGLVWPLVIVAIGVVIVVSARRP